MLLQKESVSSNDHISSDNEALVVGHALSISLDNLIIDSGALGYCLETKGYRL